MVSVITLIVDKALVCDSSHLGSVPSTATDLLHDHGQVTYSLSFGSPLITLE